MNIHDIHVNMPPDRIMSVKWFPCYDQKYISADRLPHSTLLGSFHDASALSQHYPIQPSLHNGQGLVVCTDWSMLFGAVQMTTVGAFFYYEYISYTITFKILKYCFCVFLESDIAAWRL